MLAYQKPKHRPLASLADRLAASDTALRAESEDGTLLSERDSFAPISERSQHARDWSYVVGGAPGTIQVWHLWDLATPVPVTPPEAGAAPRSTRKFRKAQ